MSAAQHDLTGDHAVSGGGFTGVDWERRPPRELHRALHDGPGPAPAGEAGAAWTATAAELEVCALEIRALCVLLHSDVVIKASPVLAELGEELAAWCEHAATRARGLAERTLGHSTQLTRALAAMPGASELDSVRDALGALELLGPGIAGLLGGAHNAVEHAESEIERTAAGVMREYEAGTEALVAWREEPEPAPRLTLSTPTAGRTRGAVSVPVEPGRPRPEVGATETAPPPTAAPVGAALDGAVGGAVVSQVRIPTGPVAPAESPYAQVRPAAMSLTSPIAAVPTAGSGPGGPAGMVTTSTTVAAEAAPAVAPMAPAAPAAAMAGAPDTSSGGPVAARQPTRVAASELYGLSVAVAPAVIGSTGGAA